MKDLFGKALLDYQNGNYTEDLITATSISDKDELPLPYLFRGFEDMPKLEQKALQLSKGKTLDVGCGAGNHSLYLQNQGVNVVAIDQSEGAIKVSKERGVVKTELKTILDYNIKDAPLFDTILLLMNGTGIFQTVKQTPNYLKHLKSLLNTGGQILIDSSDIKYMYLDEDGGFWQDVNANYYGELDYYLSYKTEEETPMKWLYLDFNLLQKMCNENGLKCEMLAKGEHYDYLAKLSI